MAKTLKELKVGEKAVVSGITAQGALKRRIFDMGVTPGTEVLLRKVAPLGDPLECTLRGYELSIRKSEAEHIVLKD